MMMQCFAIDAEISMASDILIAKTQQCVNVQVKSQVKSSYLVQVSLHSALDFLWSCSCTNWLVKQKHA